MKTATNNDEALMTTHRECLELENTFFVALAMIILRSLFKETTGISEKKQRSKQERLSI